MLADCMLDSYHIQFHQKQTDFYLVNQLTLSLFQFQNDVRETILLIKMRGNNQRDQQRRQQQDCSKGWQCPRLLDGHCDNRHSAEEKDNATSFNTLMKNNPKKQIVIILDTYTKQLKPITLLEPFLPIELTKIGDEKLSPGVYYIGVFSQIYRGRVVIKYQGALGQFGNWKTQIKIFQQFFPTQFSFKNPEDQRLLDGQIIVNDSYTKILVGDRGHKYFLQPVNRPYNYPILKGTKVRYFQNKNRAQIVKINYPRQIRLSGIIQIDKRSQFYFKSRNPQYDDMNPYFIPKDISKYLEKWSYLFPYSMIKQEKLKEDKLQDINKILNGLLVKGYFKDWPTRCIYPIIELEDQVLERNIKNMKSAIIFESGIEIRSFSKNEKTQADKLVKNFKIQSHKNRQTLRNGIFTIDSKQTKCHDDAVYVRKLENGNFQVEIHIADVAQLIKRKTKLDDEIRKRDETIYIKNHHQPMIPESLKNMLSLKENNDKLAFSLSFEVDSRGFIDFRTVEFFKSIINVEQNLTHQQLSKNEALFPNFFELNKRLDAAKLVDSNYILQCQSKSQAAMTKLIFLSAIVPTYLLQENIKRSKELKIAIDAYLKQMVSEKKLEMEKWEDKVTLINSLNRQAAAIKKTLVEIQNKVKKQVEKQRNRITQELKKEEKQSKAEKKEKKKQQKRRKQQSGERGQATDSQAQTQGLDEESEQIPDLQSENISKKDISERGGIQIEEIDQQKQKKQKEKRAKVMQDSKLKDFLSQSSVSSSQDSEEDDQLGQDDERFKMNKAVGGRNFLQRIFSIFNIKIQWKSLNEINEAFKLILSKDKGQIYQEYFKRMQIMNRQHFKYIIRLARQEKREVKGGKEEEKYQKSEKSFVTESTKGNQKRKNQRYKKKEQQITTKGQDDTNQEKTEKNIKKEQKGKGELKEQISEKKKKYQPIQQSLIKEEKIAEKQSQIQLNIKSQEKLEPDPQNQKLENKATKEVKEKFGQRSQKNRNRVNQYKASNKEKHNNKDFNKKQHSKPLVELSQKDRQTQQLLLKRVLNQKDRLIQKHKNSLLNKEDIQISEDQIILGQQAQQVREILRAIKKKQIIKLINIQMRIDKKQAKQAVKNRKEQQKKQTNEVDKVDKIQQKKQNQEVEKAEKPKKRQRQGKNKVTPEVTVNKSKRQNNPKVQERVDEIKLKLAALDQAGREKNQQVKRLVQAQKDRLVQKYKALVIDNLQLQVSDDQITQKQEKQDLKVFLKDTKKAMIIKAIKSFLKEQNIKLQKKKNPSRTNPKAQITKQQTKEIILAQKFQPFQKSQPEEKPQNQVKILSVKNQINNKHKQEQNLHKHQQLGCEEKPSLQSKEKEVQQAKKKALSKNQLKKKIELLLKPLADQIKSKYQDRKSQIASKVKELQSLLLQNRQAFRQELQKAEKDYNVIRILSLGQQTEEKQTDKKSRKEKKKKETKKDKKNNKDQKKTFFQNFLNNFETYAKKANFKFKKMQEDEIDDCLENQFKIKDILTDQTIQESNRAASQLGNDEQKLLKWNNPIRSYISLEVMRLIKTYRWLFQGKLHPIDVIRYSQDIKDIQKELKSLEDYREEKLAKGETDKKAKQANREIAKLQFYSLVKVNEKAIHKFLTVTSPPRCPVKRVFHPILNEVDVKKNHNYDLFKQVKGTVKIVSEFPLEFQVQLL